MKTKVEKEDIQMLKNLLNEARGEADNLAKTLRKYRNVLLSTKLVMGHELKKPATAIAGYLDLVLEALESPGRNLRKAINEALASARKARQECKLLDELNQVFLALLKMDGERRIAPQKEINLKDVFNDVLDGFPLGYKASSRVEVRISPRVDFINFNPDALKLILTNLIENALLYSEKDSKVIVDVKKVIDKRGMSNREILLITIVDHGEGIPREYLKKIFNPFVRLHKSKIEGTGLGLTLVRSLVELHGGEISLNSEKGKGTVVHLTVPVFDSEESQLVM